jgi:hypothetical protein
MKWKHTIESYTAANPALPVDAPIRRRFVIDRQGQRATDERLGGVECAVKAGK